MGDMMNRPPMPQGSPLASQGGPPPSGRGVMGAGADPISKNMSFFNPADMAAMKEQKIFTADMTVAQALAKVGIDVNGPAPQIVDFAKKQLENGDVVKKMENINADTGEGEPPVGDGEGAIPPPTPEAGGIDALMQRR